MKLKSADRLILCVLRLGNVLSGKLQNVETLDRFNEPQTKEESMLHQSIELLSRPLRARVQKLFVYVTLLPLQKNF